MMNIVAQYDIWLVDLNPQKGHTQAGVRPCIVVQSNIFNKYSPLVLVVPMTSVIKEPFPSEFIIDPSQYNGLSEGSRVLGSQIITLDKSFLVKKLGVLEQGYHDTMKKAIRLVLGL